MILSNHDDYLKNGLYLRAEKTANFSRLDFWQPSYKLNRKIRSIFPRGYIRQLLKF